MNKTIACISTAFGKSAIAVVRMSGDKSLEIAKKFFSSKNLSYEKTEPSKMYLGEFVIAENIKEKCLMAYFKNPHSYTGEDIVEFQIHGGTVVAESVLAALLGGGAVLAEPGELTRRAFENGKLSLDEAESIADEIHAESEAELKASLSTSGGKLKKEILNMQDSLTEMLAQIEATLDYPEEDFEKSVKEKILDDIKNVDKNILKLIQKADNGKYISKGIFVAIVGAPNVGKSSLLNAFLGDERAIVTDIEGTTRDTISETLIYKGVKLNLIDTAGIREAKDVVEQIGIQRSKDALNSADVILFLLDGSRELSEQDKKIQSILKNKTYFTIVNKMDKARVLPAQPNEISVSALNETNIEQLKEHILRHVIKEEIDFNQMVITNERQASILKDCKCKSEEILSSFEQSMDIIAMQLKRLWETLGKITGQTENENIIDLIFAKFCLGK